MRSKYSITRDFGEVQVKNHQVRCEAGFSQYLERLFAVPGDVEMNGHRAFGKRLPDEQSVSGIIFN